MLATVGMDNAALLGEQPNWLPVPAKPLAADAGSRGGRLSDSELGALYAWYVKGTVVTEPAVTVEAHIDRYTRCRRVVRSWRAGTARRRSCRHRASDNTAGGIAGRQSPALAVTSHSLAPGLIFTIGWACAQVMPANRSETRM
jgi:hypothetical protein